MEIHRRCQRCRRLPWYGAFARATCYPRCPLSLLSPTARNEDWQLDWPPGVPWKDLPVRVSRHSWTTFVSPPTVLACGPSYTAMASLTRCASALVGSLIETASACPTGDASELLAPPATLGSVQALTAPVKAGGGSPDLPVVIRQSKVQRTRVRGRRTPSESHFLLQRAGFARFLPRGKSCDE